MTDDSWRSLATQSIEALGAFLGRRLVIDENAASPRRAPSASSWSCSRTTVTPPGSPSAGSRATPQSTTPSTSRSRPRRAGISSGTASVAPSLGWPTRSRRWADPGGLVAPGPKATTRGLDWTAIMAWVDDVAAFLKAYYPRVREWMSYSRQQGW